MKILGMALGMMMVSTSTFALDDKTWVHWNIVSIKAGDVNLKVGQTPLGIQLENDDENASYGGMCPTDGQHTYCLTVFALNDAIDVADDEPRALTLEAFKDEYGDLILAVGGLKGRF